MKETTDATCSSKRSEAGSPGVLIASVPIGSAGDSYLLLHLVFFSSVRLPPSHHARRVDLATRTPESGGDGKGSGDVSSSSSYYSSSDHGRGIALDSHVGRLSKRAAAPITASCAETESSGAGPRAALGLRLHHQSPAFLVSSRIQRAVDGADAPSRYSSKSQSRKEPDRAGATTAVASVHGPATPLPNQASSAIYASRPHQLSPVVGAGARAHPATVAGPAIAHPAAVHAAGVAVLAAVCALYEGFICLAASQPSFSFPIMLLPSFSLL